jgi:transposase
MKTYLHFYGVDVSKHTLDIAFTGDGKTVDHVKMSNDKKGLRALATLIKKNQSSADTTLFCMEATGIYGYRITQFLFAQGIDLWIEHAPMIKKTAAFMRGKNDKADALRIMQYAIKNLDQLRLYKPTDATMDKIKHLLAARERLVQTKSKLTVPIEEMEQVGDPAIAKILRKSVQKTLRALEHDLEQIQMQIESIVQSDEHLNDLYKIVSSVVGIGFVTALQLIVYTHGFTKINDARKLACYCGVAPFEYSSGISVRGRTRVHPMANKKLKCSLHLCALSAIKCDPDIKQYYERKVAEGKNKMSVLNAVRNKLLTRVVACANHQRLYVKKAA